jgi:hypothetical protein
VAFLGIYSKGHMSQEKNKYGVWAVEGCGKRRPFPILGIVGAVEVQDRYPNLAKGQRD